MWNQGFPLFRWLAVLSIPKISSANAFALSDWGIVMGKARFSMPRKARFYVAHYKLAICSLPAWTQKIPCRKINYQTNETHRCQWQNATPGQLNECSDRNKRDKAENIFLRLDIFGLDCGLANACEHAPTPMLLILGRWQRACSTDWNKGREDSIQYLCPVWVIESFVNIII